MQLHEKKQKETIKNDNSTKGGLKRAGDAVELYYLLENNNYSLVKINSTT